MKIWKYIVALWMTVVIILGFSIKIPQIDILEQTARNLFLHVPMWFTMMVAFAMAFYYSVRYLNDETKVWDRKAETATAVGLMFGICGLLTGSLWARFTWGTWWTFAEPRMNLSALAMMIFVAYFILRTAFNDPEKRAKISAVYNIFGVTTIPFLLYIIPRQLPSLHPGADGNPAFSDMTAPELRIIFYPAVIGFIGLAIWIMDIINRYKHVKDITDEAQLS
ncbi:cytochrome c biogenesis protein CcsA [Rhodohalobacter halophilus]|uniref:cytochrome c biogenesis protein CcsA n=1 Tax=Rhodohalobacter halophilus TaxID=1812810 RepID=UPI001FE1F8D8|nr:cytochrome c biogenesis protein CcsA [Rhodohalobacter halophilus]